MLQNGGMANWFDGKNTRVLCHIPAIHRPIQRLPWPLSVFQPHLLEFRVYEGDGWTKAGAQPIQQALFKKPEMEHAIELFLQGAEENAAIIITED